MSETPSESPGRAERVVEACLDILRGIRLSSVAAQEHRDQNAYLGDRSHGRRPLLRPLTTEWGDQGRI